MVYSGHQAHLATLLWIISLIDTDRIDPGEKNKQVLLMTKVQQPCSTPLVQYQNLWLDSCVGLKIIP